MQYRAISQSEAIEVLLVLQQECGYRCNEDRDQYAFMLNIMDCASPCHEYRFIGSLGFGGKFRNNGNHDGIPHVDCYSEDLTPEREAMIEAANKRLLAIFE